MAIKKIIAICLLIPAYASVACADDYYAGGSFVNVDYSESGFEEASLSALGGRIGRQFNDNFSGEVRAGVGLGDDSINVAGLEADVEIDHFYGVYFRGGFQLGPSLYPYAVLGYTRGEAEVSVSGFGSETETESDVSFGAGIDFQLGEAVDLNIEYMNFLDKDNTEIEGFLFGFTRRF